MELARREFIIAGGAAAGLAAAVAAPAAARTVEAMTPVAIHDPALPATRALAKARAPAGTRQLALEGDRVRFWQRELAAHHSAITGCTSWSDLVILRGLAAEQGLRLRAHTRHATPRGTVFLWVLA